MPARGEVICVRERRTGSNRVRKVCRTREEIRREEDQARETFDDLHRSQEDY